MAAQLAVLTSVPSALHTVAGTPMAYAVAMAAGLAAFEGGRFAVIAFFAARARRNGWSFLPAFPVALAATECLYPMLFPWSTSLFLHAAPVLLQGAEFGGQALVSLWAGLLAASIAMAWRLRKRLRDCLSYALVVPAATVAVATVGGAMRMHAIDERISTAERVRVGLVQGNVADAATDSALVHRTLERELVRSKKPDLMIWPETAISYPVNIDRLTTILVERAARDPARVDDAVVDVPLLLGAVIDRESPQLPAHVHSLATDGSWRPVEKKRFNSAVLAAPNGTIHGEYDKRDLVPFGEYLPFETLLPWLRRLLPRAGSFSPGVPSVPLPFHGKRLLVLICYEDILAERVRDDVIASEPDLLINLSSDAWFSRSRVPALHLALAQMRAIEHRRFLVHATSTGLTAVIDPTGRVFAELPPNQSATEIVSVGWLRSTTAYEALGRVPSILLGVIAVFLALCPQALALRRFSMR
jgi:apolipoprotein N-acyltransferase